MLMSAADGALLVVDVQEKLLPHIHDWQAVMENTLWLMRVAKRVGVPLMVTEQYPKGLGHSAPAVLTEVAGHPVVEKMHFSCASAQCLLGLPGSDRRQVVICGTEAHVCVLQTALELRWQGKEVFVVADAVGSRDPANKALALERMRRHGIEVVGREMVAFEWLRVAGTELFRDVSKEFLR